MAAALIAAFTMLASGWLASAQGASCWLGPVPQPKRMCVCMQLLRYRDY